MFRLILLSVLLTTQPAFSFSVIADSSHTGRLAKRMLLLHAAGSDNLAAVIDLLPRASRSTMEMVLRIAAMEDALTVVSHLLTDHRKSYDHHFLMKTLCVAGEFDAPRVVNYLLYKTDIDWEQTDIDHALGWTNTNDRAQLTQQLLSDFLIDPPSDVVPIGAN